MDKLKRSLLGELLLMVIFLFLSPVALFASFWLLGQNKEAGSGVVAGAAVFMPSLRLYTALPPTGGNLSFEVRGVDSRPVLLKQYLAYYHSPLEPYADYIFAVSEKYSLDYRLLVAIAQQESNLGKKIPPGSYNAWGWGIHSRGTLGFSGWEEAIETVARGLREDYLNQGLTTPEEIMSKYTPLSNGSWAAGVNQFMAEIEEGKTKRDTN